MYNQIMIQQCIWLLGTMNKVTNYYMNIAVEAVPDDTKKIKNGRAPMLMSYI